MALAVDVINSSAEIATASSITWAHTCVANSILIVFVHWNTPATTILSVTYNGATMTFIPGSNSHTNAAVAAYFLSNPTTGSSLNVVVTLSATVAGGYGGSVSITGAYTAYQGDVIPVLHTVSGESTASSSITNVSNQALILAAISTQTSSTTINASPGTQTSGYHNHGAHMNAAMDYVTALVTDSAKTATSFGFSSLVADDMVTLAIRPDTQNKLRINVVRPRIFAPGIAR